MVSGTNGKTTTTHFLAAAVRRLARRCGCPSRLVHNADGANLHHGIASALSEHPDADIAILETDERVVADMIRLGKPEVLVLLNFSRDQLDRHHEIKGLGRSWRDALTAAGADGPVVVANADEPLIVWAAQTAREVVWVDTATTWTQDASLCPNCGSDLVREQPGPAPAGSGGDWHCTGCDLAQPTADYRCSTARSSTPTEQVWDPELNVPGAFNVSNAACALAAAELDGCRPRHRAWPACGPSRRPRAGSPPPRFGDTTARLLLAKNPAGWAEALPLATTRHGRAGDRLRGRRRPGRLLAVGRRLRAAGRTDRGRHRSPGAGSRRPAAVRRGRAPLRARPRRGPGRSPRTGRRDRDLHAVPAAEEDGGRVMATRWPTAGGSRSCWSTSPCSASTAIAATPACWSSAWRGAASTRADAWSSRASPLPDSGHVYLLGGGEDAAQITAVRELRPTAGCTGPVDRGAVVFAVCAGYQIVGNSFTVGDRRRGRSTGLGLLDVTTTRGPVRAVGEILSRAGDGHDGDADR